MAGVYVNELLLLIFPEDGWWISKSAFSFAPKLFAKDVAADVSHESSIKNVERDNYMELVWT
jgi:hypothetical protein